MALKPMPITPDDLTAPAKGRWGSTYHPEVGTWVPDKPPTKPDESKKKR